MKSKWVNLVMGKAGRSPMTRGERDDKTSAYHEACHSVIALVVGLPVAGAVVLPRAATLNVRAKGYIQSMMSRGLDISNAGGVTLIGSGSDETARVCADNEQISEEVYDFLPAVLTQTVAPALWELQTDFVDKNLIQVHTSGDARSVKRDWEVLPQELYDKFTFGGEDHTIPKPKPCESAVGLPDVEVDIQEPFPLWYAFNLLRLPAVQKAIAAIGDYLLEHHWITGDVAEDLTLQVFEAEIKRYQQGPVDDFKYEFESCSPLLAEVLRIDRLHFYDDLRNNVRRVKAMRLRIRRSIKRRSKESAA